MNEGSVVQPDAGRGHRSGHRHGHELRSSTGATATSTPTRSNGVEDAHLRGRPERPRDHGRSGRRGRHVPRPRERALGAREQRRADGDAQRRRRRSNEGTTHTLHATRSPIRASDTFTVNTPAIPTAAPAATTWRHADTTASGGSFDVHLPGRAGDDRRHDQGDRFGRRARHRLRTSVVVNVANVAPVVTLGGARARSPRARRTPTATRSTDPGRTRTSRRSPVAYRLRRQRLSSSPSARRPARQLRLHLRGRPEHVRRRRVDRHRRGRRLRLRHDRGHGQQRRSDDRDQRRRERERGLGLQPDPGRGHRSGHRHGHELRRPLGRRHDDTYAHERREDAHLRRRPERLDDDHRRPDRRGRHVPRRANAFSVHVDNVAPSIAISGART